MKEKKNEKASRQKNGGGGGVKLPGHYEEKPNSMPVIMGKAVKIQAMKKCLERHLGK